MHIKRSALLALASAALATGALVSTASAGTVKDTNGQVIAGGTVLHAIGWTRFQVAGTGIECHVTANIEFNAGGTTAQVTNFSIATSTCHGFGVAYANCTVTEDEVLNLPYPATVLASDIQVEDEIVITSTLGATAGHTCAFTFDNFFFEEITLSPLQTGTSAVTNTAGHLAEGETAPAGTPIAGFEIEGEGLAINNNGALFLLADGELEITSPNRCTYKIEAS